MSESGAKQQQQAQQQQAQAQQQQQQQVKFHMTVKLDIEGRQPSDLLLRLQPLFAAAAAGGASGAVQSPPRPAEDSSALELSLGLSLGSSGGDGSGGSLRRSQSLAAPLQAGDFLRSWGDEPFLGVPPPPQPASPPRPDSEERRKRVLQSERRQEARKKRRILINEQRAAMQGGGGVARARSKRTREDSLSPPRDRREYSGGAEEQAQCRAAAAPPLPPPHPTGSKVKVENVAAEAGGGGSVFRPSPSPVHERSNEWAQRFLGMQQQQQQQKIAAAEDPPPLLEAEDQQEKLPAASFSNKQAVASQDNRSHLDGSISRSSFQVDTPPSLFRSASLGSSFGSFKPAAQNSTEPEQQQQHETSAAAAAVDSNNNTNSQASSSSLLRTLSDGLTRKGVSAFRSPKKEELRSRSFIKRCSSMGFATLGSNGSPAAAAAGPSSSQGYNGATTSMSKFGGAATGANQSLPLVSATGTGPDGKTVSGVLFAYKKGDVKIICACHGHHMTAKEFVEHAGGVDVVNPEKCIVVNPSLLTRSKSMINYCSSSRPL